MKRTLSALIATVFLLTSCSVDFPKIDTGNTNTETVATAEDGTSSPEQEQEEKAAKKKAAKKKAAKAEKKAEQKKTDKAAKKKAVAKKAKKKAAAAKKEKAAKKKKSAKKKAAANNGSAMKTLNTLPVKGRAPKTGYSRDKFGPAWKDVDGNGCDTRNDMLNRDLTNVVHGDNKGCKVLSGVLADPYTGKQINFQRGTKTSLEVHIDHVVALSDAWQKGAQQISADKRLHFANDPLNLLASDGPANIQKSDSDAASWLPSHKPSRCPMVARQIAVKSKYKLWVTQPEKEAMGRVLSAFPSQGLPKASDGIATKTTGMATKTPAKPSKSNKNPAKPKNTKGGKTDPRFGTCKEAKQNGYGNYVRGKHVEYDWYRDGDGDGVTCER